VTPAARRQAVAIAQEEHGLSRRRACRLIGISRSLVEQEPKRAREHARLRERLRALAGERRRFGDRRLHELLRHEGWSVNHKLVARLYREEKLALRRRGRQKRRGGTRAGLWCPIAANQRWSLDVTEDCLANGRKFRTADLKDDCTRACPAIIADFSLPGARVVAMLDHAAGLRGYPDVLVVDNVLRQGALGCARQGISVRQCRPASGRRQPSRAASALAGKTLSHSEHRIQRPGPWSSPSSTRGADPSGRPDHYLQGRGRALTAQAGKGFSRSAPPRPRRRGGSLGRS
jgi:transposase